LGPFQRNGKESLVAKNGAMRKGKKWEEKLKTGEFVNRTQSYKH